MSLTGKQIANSYLDLLQMNNNNAGVPVGAPITVRDGNGTPTPLQLSQGTVNINGTFQYNGIALTTNVSGLNAAAAGSSLVTGIVAEDGNTKYGRTLTASTGVTITNADGTGGNPTFAIADTSVSAASYGPMNSITVNAQGQITDVSAVTTISANAFIGGTLSGSSLYVENNVSVSGTMAVAGNTNISGTVSIAGNTSIGGNLQVGGNFGVSGSTSISGKLTVENIVTSVVSATYLYGDGSNITGLAGAGTMTEVRANTGIFMTVNGTTTTDITGSGTIGLKTDQSFGVVSATFFVIGGDNVAMSATVASLSATMATSIDNSNTVIAAVSALTSVNSAAITSINSNITSLSATMATSIDNSNIVIAAVSALTSVNTAAITSINSIIGSGGIASSATVAALSATMATSIDNSNTNITANTNSITSINTVVGNNTTNIAAVSVLASVNSAAITSINTVVGTNTTNITTNTNAITSINTVVDNLSATFATSINNQATAITALSATMATSINNTNTNLTTVSAYATSITQALSATMATSINNHLPLAGGTLTGGVIAATQTVSANATTTPDFGSYTNFVWTLDGNLTLGNPTTEAGGMGGTFVFIQDSTGSRTLSVGSEYKTVGGSITLSTAAGSVDVVPYFVQVTGTVLLGSPSLALS